MFLSLCLFPLVFGATHEHSGVIPGAQDRGFILINDKALPPSTCHFPTLKIQGSSSGDLDCLRGLGDSSLFHGALRQRPSDSWVLPGQRLPKRPQKPSRRTLLGGHRLGRAIYKVRLKGLPESLSEIVYTVIRSCSPLFHGDVLRLERLSSANTIFTDGFLSAAFQPKHFIRPMRR